MANSNGGYGQFCPVSMAAELVCTRWTINVIRELLQGSSRFNDLRRGLPRMSPALLSKRLKELEAGGIVERTGTKGPGGVSYVLTPAGRALGDVVESIGRWGHRWLETHLSLQNLDPSLLMWDMRRRLNPDPMPPGKAVIQFVYPELSATRRQWWLLVDKGKDVDLCSIDPGFDVNLYVVTALKTMTSIWMGLSTLEEELNRDTVRLTGDAALQQSMSQWLGLNHFAKAERR